MILRGERDDEVSAFPEAYVQYLLYFHGERDYFECHEVLEEYWKNNPDSPLREAWVGLIQVAVGMYHERRHNFRGAYKMLASALQKLTDRDLRKLGIAAEEFRDILAHRLEQLTGERQADHVFRDINIPLVDEELIIMCKEQCAMQGVEWGRPSDLSAEYLVHKHKLRDRSDVVAERSAQLAQRQQLRGER